MLIPKIAQSTTYIFVQRATLARSLRDSLEKNSVLNIFENMHHHYHHDVIAKRPCRRSRMLRVD